MKKYNISVNGKSYEVEVEEIGANTHVSTPTPPRAAAPAPIAAPTPEKTAKAPAVDVPAGSTTVTAPMPGTILDIRVNVGDVVANGDVLLILEAMKMENEIMAGNAGKIASISVTKGASVSSGDVLIILE